jgi:hypothetical protein
LKNGFFSKIITANNKLEGGNKNLASNGFARTDFTVMLTRKKIINYKPGSPKPNYFVSQFSFCRISYKLKVKHYISDYFDPH